MRDVEIEALRNRIAQLAAEGHDQEREVPAWLPAELQMREPAGFNPGRRLADARRVRRLRYPFIEAN
jgi:hypothetical protein